MQVPIPAVGAISARIVFGTLRCAEGAGMKTEALWSQLPGGRQCPPDHFIPLAVHFAIWEQLMRTLRRPGLPIQAGRDRRSEDLQVRIFAAMSAGSGWEALRKGLYYAGLTTNSAEWQMSMAHPDHSGVWVRFLREGARTLGHRVANECALASCVAQLRAILDPELIPDGVYFRHSEPIDLTEHQSFFGCPVVFDAPADGFVLHPRYLEAAPIAANPDIGAYFERVARTQLEARRADQSALVQRVWAVVEEQVGVEPLSTLVVSKKVGMSPRALRRALARDGIGFSTIVAEVRIRKAQRLIEEGRLSLGEVALELGFEDQSSFNRFYRHHRGTTPGSQRLH